LRRLLFLIIPLLTFSAKLYHPFVKYEIFIEMCKIEIPLLKEEYYDAFFMAANYAQVEVLDLAAICYAESSMMKFKNHPNKLDVSPMGLHETKKIHAERVKKWGEYNPNNPYDYTRISALEYKEELDKFRNKDLAFSAYHKGTNWVDKHGVCHYYIKMINHYMEAYCGH